MSEARSPIWYSSTAAAMSSSKRFRSTPADMSQGVLDGLSRVGFPPEARRRIARLARSLRPRNDRGGKRFSRAKRRSYRLHHHQGSARHARDAPHVPREHVRHAGAGADAAGEPALTFSRSTSGSTVPRRDRTGPSTRRRQAIAARNRTPQDHAVGSASSSHSAIRSTNFGSSESSRRAVPDVYVSMSYEVCPEIRDYERACTTHLNAYLQPPVDHYLRRLDRSCNRAPPRRRCRSCNPTAA